MEGTESASRARRGGSTVVAGLAPRIAAAAAAACLALHVALLLAAGGSMLIVTGPMLALSIVCTTCALHGWQGRSSHGDQAAMALSSASMVLLHLMTQHGHDGSGHGGAAQHAGATPAVDLLMHAAVTLAAAQALLVGVGMYAQYRDGSRAGAA